MLYDERAVVMTIYARNVRSTLKPVLSLPVLLQHLDAALRRLRTQRNLPPLQPCCIKISSMVDSGTDHKLQR